MDGNRTHRYWVYIMSNMHHTLYVGMTNDLYRRVLEHKRGTGSSFAARYHLTDLVYFEEHRYVLNAIGREKQIKGWLRAKKVAMIEAENPQWIDLNAGWYEEQERSHFCHPERNVAQSKDPLPCRREDGSFTSPRCVQDDKPWTTCSPEPPQGGFVLIHSFDVR